MTSRTHSGTDTNQRRVGTNALTLGVALAVATVVPSVVLADSTGSPPNAPTPVLDAPTVDDLSPAEVDMILEDSAFELDGDQLRVTEPPLVGPAPVENAPADKDSGPQSATSVATAFSLHTRPTSGRKIFLDFDGHVTSNTAWNNTANPVIDSGVYSREANGFRNDTFSPTELDGIVEIWARVADDFAAWDVDVTTADPGTAGLKKSSPTDTEYGIRVVISQDSDWYGPYGGAAYLYSFNSSSDLPAFIFSSNLANGNPKSVAEAVSHEVGHSFGLSHDGIENSDGSVNPYYSGHGNWAPIMGVGYSKPITQWSRGEYAGATNTEDDIAKIETSVNRLPDQSGTNVLGGGDSMTTHTIVAGASTARHPLQVNGGPVTVTVHKADAAGNLLARLTIRNSSGTIVASATPTTSTDWTVTAQLPAGTAAGSYSLEVGSIGWMTPSTGFSAYGSLGSYVIEIDAPDSTGTTTTTTTTTPPLVTIPGGPGTTTTTTIAPTTTTASTTTTPTTTTTTTPTTPTTGPKPPTDDTAVGDRLTALTPDRLLDTRSSTAPLTRLRAGRQVRLQIPGLRDDVSAVVVNVVAVQPSSTGWLSVTACAPVALADRTSSVNFVVGHNVGNSIIAPVASDGSLCLYASAATDVIIDVTGQLEPDGESALSGISSHRVVDTRIDQGITNRLTPGRVTTVSLDSVTGMAAVDAVAVNVTAVNPSSSGFLTINDCSADSADSADSAATSSLNFGAGVTRGNNGIFSVSSDNTLCITSSASTDLTVDVTGRFVPGEGLTFVAATPTRLLDTRSGRPLAAASSAAFTIPEIATKDGGTLVPAAASVNIAAALQPEQGFVTSWNCGTRPQTSALNPVAGLPTANSAVVPTTSTGRSCLFHSAGGHLIVDLTGWWV